MLNKLTLPLLLVGTVLIIRPMERYNQKHLRFNTRKFEGHSATETLNSLRSSGEYYEPSTTPPTQEVDLWDLAYRARRNKNTPAQNNQITTPDNQNDDNDDVDLLRLAQERYFVQQAQQRNSNGNY